MYKYTDQLNHSIHLKERPKRIVSVVPSQSEFLWEIGLRSELAGITKFCIHPLAMFTSIERVGGTKDLNLEKIRALKPDLIIGNKEENEKGQMEQLQKEFNVWMSDIYTLDDAYHMMESIGEICDKQEMAEQLVAEIKKSLATVKGYFKKRSTAYFIWNKPYMCAAQQTFIDHLLNYLGLENALAHLERYPAVSVEALQKISPELCFLSSEPFPFKAKHVKALQEKLPAAKIIIVDGEMFSWYGPRLLHLADYVKCLKL